MRFTKQQHVRGRELPWAVRSTNQAYYSEGGPGDPLAPTQSAPKGWIIPTPVPATAGMFPLTTDAARSAINATRIAYISSVSGVAPSLGKMYYVIAGVGIVDETGSATGAGAVAYGTDPMNPTGPIVAWKHWAAVGPLAGGAIAGVRGDQASYVNNPGPTDFLPGTSLRQRAPDWWLFKRGETWDLSDDLVDYKTIATLFNATSQSLTTCGGNTWLSRQVVGAYGSLSVARPRISSKMGWEAVDRQNTITTTNQAWKNVQYMDLLFDGDVRDPSLADIVTGLSPAAVRTLYLGPDSLNIMFQGCLWDGCGTSATNGAAARVQSVTITQAAPGVLSVPAAASFTTAAGYAIGATTISLAAGSAQIVDKQAVLFAGDTNVYRVIYGGYANGTIVIEAPGLLQAIPAVVTNIQAGHGLSARDRVTLTTTGVLPGGFATGTAYWVHTAITGADFTLKTSPEGATAITTTTAGSGTHQVQTNRDGANHIIYHRCGILDSFGSLRDPSHVQGLYYGGYNGKLQISEMFMARNAFKYSGVKPRYMHEKPGVTISVGTPAAVGWVGHGLLANDPVVFNTTSTYPAGFDVAAKGQVKYFVSAVLTPDSFSVSLTAGGAAINTTAAGAGTITCIIDVRLAGGGLKVATVPIGTVFNRNLYLGGKSVPKYCWVSDSMILRGGSADQSRGGLQFLRNFIQSGGYTNGGYGGHDDADGSTGCMIGNWLQTYVLSPQHPGWGFSLEHGAAYQTVCGNVVSHAQQASTQYALNMYPGGWGGSGHFYSYPIRGNKSYGNHFESGTSKPVTVGDGIMTADGPTIQIAYAAPGNTGNTVTDNVMISSAAAPEYAYTQYTNGPATNDTVYSGNVTYASRAAAMASLGGADWDRTLKTYLVSLGQTVTSIDGVDEMCVLWINGMRRGDWTLAYTNRSLLNYLRAGRNLGTFKPAVA